MSGKAWLAVFGSLTVAGCGGSNMADLEEYAERVKAREPRPIEPLPEMKRIDRFTFEPADRRDPFVIDRQSAEVAASPGNGIAPDPLRRKEELEQYSLDSLDMVGTLEQLETTWGLVTAPSGTLYRVRVGNYMGMNNGQITRVTEEKIELTEIFSDGDGDWRERQAAVALSQ
ncbi:MAG: pilus assembly protein PilP [Pseudomonadota bacterium]|nr:pilus assembly protein PilP [Pseudomonadota bacterium]